MVLTFLAKILATIQKTPHHSKLQASQLNSRTSPPAPKMILHAAYGSAPCCTASYPEILPTQAGRSKSTDIRHKTAAPNQTQTLEYSSQQYRSYNTIGAPTCPMNSAASATNLHTLQRKSMRQTVPQTRYSQCGLLLSSNRLSPALS